MKLQDIWAPLGAVVVLGLAIYAALNPGATRLSPAALFFIALLLGIRYAARRQAQKRQQVAKEVPKHPLGLDESQRE